MHDTMNMPNEITEQEAAALLILRQTGMDIVEVAMIARDALLWTKGRGNRLKRVQKCLIAGNRVLQEEERSVTLQTAIKTALEERSSLSLRTRRDFRYLMKRLLKFNPEGVRRIVSGMTPEQCGEMIERAFSTPRQRYKARLVFSSVFSTAMRHGWCNRNPLRLWRAPRVREQTVPILSMDEIRALVRKAREYESGCCLPAVGLMLYAGIRPTEVERLRWKEVNSEEKVVVLSPQHTKTGGARCVNIHAPLMQILRENMQHTPEERICPTGWRRHWRTLRREAGWCTSEHPWIQDVLRHTYASYHLRHFRNLHELQIEMGHGSPELLRTRYLNMQGMGDADAFWRALPE